MGERELEAEGGLELLAEIGLAIRGYSHSKGGGAEIE